MYWLATSYKSTKDYVFHPKLVISTCRFYRYYHRKTCFEGFSKKNRINIINIHKIIQWPGQIIFNFENLWLWLWHYDTMTLWHSLELEEITANWEIPIVTWSIVTRDWTYSPVTMSCKLCLLEKCFINPEFHNLGTSARYKCNM